MTARVTALLFMAHIAGHERQLFREVTDMSLTTYLIEMQYQNSMRCAEDLEKCAEIISKVSASDVNDIFENVKGAWKGEPANTCLRKITNVQGDIGTDGKNIERAAEIVKTIAENVRRAELEAYRIATGRSY